MASSHQRDKRAARRQGQAQPSAHLAPHSARCECSGCEKRAQDRLHRAQEGRDKRARRDHAGAPDSEYRSDWHVSLHRLVQYMDMHLVTFRKRKVTAMDMLPAWLDRLDRQGPQSSIDAVILYEALLGLEMLQPLAGRLVRACCIEERTHRDVAGAEGVDHSTVSRQLASACDDLLDLYGVLVAIEQRRTAAASA